MWSNNVIISENLCYQYREKNMSMSGNSLYLTLSSKNILNDIPMALSYKNISSIVEIITVLFTINNTKV